MIQKELKMELIESFVQVLLEYKNEMKIGIVLKIKFREFCKLSFFFVLLFGNKELFLHCFLGLFVLLFGNKEFFKWYYSGSFTLLFGSSCIFYFLFFIIFWVF